MELVKILSEMALEEARDACHYAKCAVKYKESNPTLAKALYEISAQELVHMETICQEATKALEQCQKERPQEALAAAAVHEYIHERQLEKAQKAKLYQAQYKGA